MNRPHFSLCTTLSLSLASMVLATVYSWPGFPLEWFFRHDYNMLSVKFPVVASLLIAQSIIVYIGSSFLFKMSQLSPWWQWHFHSVHIRCIQHDVLLCGSFALTLPFVVCRRATTGPDSLGCRPLLLPMHTELFVVISWAVSSSASCVLLLLYHPWNLILWSVGRCNALTRNCGMQYCKGMQIALHESERITT